MRVLVLHNPTAGDQHPAAGELVDLVRRHGFDVRYASTKEPCWQDAMAEPAELVIVAGGDGTVVKAAAMLPDRARPLAILPLGGANNIAGSLGVPDDLMAALAGLPDVPVRRLDVGRARGPWGERVFLEGVGLGALARSSVRIDDSGVAPADKIRAGREALAATLRDQAARPLRLELDDGTLEGEFLMVEAMNVRSSGPLLPLAPGAEPGDGLLDLVLVGPTQRAAMLGWLADLKWKGPPPAELRRCRRLAFIWSDVPLRVDDGMPDPPPEPAEVVCELDPDPLRVLVPAQVGPGCSARDAGDGP